MRLVLLIFVVAFLTLSITGTKAADISYHIGVYYFPGWRNNQPESTYKLPWDKIKPYPNREPLLGWYDDGSVAVIEKQIAWMHHYGLDFVAFDWYFDASRHVPHKQSIEAYLKANNRDEMKFSILWANHDGMPKSLTDWDVMVHYWINHYFHNPQFLRIDGKPVVFVFSAAALAHDAALFGATSGELISRAQRIAVSLGLPGIYLVAGTTATKPMIDGRAKTLGFSAFSAYNYHAGPDHPKLSHSYAELSNDYQAQWSEFAKRGDLPLIVPLTSGWDHRPWGPSADPLHDNSRSSPAQFKSHLLAAKSFLDAHPRLTNGYGVICCWNEFGEGSFIEPTKAAGFAFLKDVQAVFGRSRDNR